MAKKKRSFLKKVLMMLVLILLIIAGVGGYWAYRNIYQPNVSLGEKKSTLIYIPTGSDFNDVVRILKEAHILRDEAAFTWLAEKKKYPQLVKPGRYRILARMSNNALVNLLRAGIQEPVTFNFNGLHTVEQLAGRVGRRIEADSLSLYRAMHDNHYLERYGFNRDNVQAFFLPDTYEFMWNTSVDQFFERMSKEYKAFWTPERKVKARATGLTQAEVAVLASIVQGEQCCNKVEQRTIAGLYINRLKAGMPLQSDPTIIFAIGDFTMQRVYNGQKSIDSPYNTYIHEGLPPGPIGFAQQDAIDAVLNYEKHDYLYMCARENLDGTHCFSKTYEQHQIYAKKYHDALDARNIK